MASALDLDDSILSSGGVSIIDYFHGRHPYHKVHPPIHTEAELRKLYQLSDKHCFLRMIYAGNKNWARALLLDVYEINTDESLASVLSAYKPQGGRTRRPMMKAEATENGTVLDGKIVRAFAHDYLQPHRKGTTHGQCYNGEQPVFELEKYDASGDPVPGYDIYHQRVSVYLQQRFKTPRSGSVIDSIPDNGNAIIVFDDSAGGQDDCKLIDVRQLQDWIRFLNDTLTKDYFHKESMGFVSGEIFKAVKSKTTLLLGLCDTQVDILEHRVYGNPEDESRASELWKASAAWMTIGRFLYSQYYVARLVHPWFPAHPAEFNRQIEIIHDIAKDMDESRQDWERSLITQRTSALLDLMFKAVGLRDARSSLELGLSMWRLSWISFIFLPLTFSVGVFGMNVDAFASNPSIKWWVITAVVILSLVMIAWYIVKQALIASQSKTYQRGAYETMCEGFASKHPTLWTRQGPSENVKFDGRGDTMK